MATRAKQKLDFAHISDYTVAAGQTATLGMAAVLSGADEEVATAGANSDLVVGFFLATAAAGERVAVCHYGPIVRALCGVGGTTRGKPQKLAADGIFDAPAHDSSGGTDDSIVGVAMQSGVDGDLVGLMLTRGNRGSA